MRSNGNRITDKQLGNKLPRHEVPPQGSKNLRATGAESENSADLTCAGMTMRSGGVRLALLPRIIRFRDSPFYLGMDRRRFNAEVRPYLTEIPIGKQGVAFDRVELDDWMDEYIARNGRPSPRGGTKWDANKRRGSSNVRALGTLTSVSTGDEFARALENVNLPKRRSTSRG